MTGRNWTPTLLPKLEIYGQVQSRPIDLWFWHPIQSFFTCSTHHFRSRKQSADRTKESSSNDKCRYIFHHGRACIKVYMAHLVLFMSNKADKSVDFLCCLSCEILTHQGFFHIFSKDTALSQFTDSATLVLPVSLCFSCLSSQQSRDINVCLGTYLHVPTHQHLII